MITATSGFMAGKYTRPRNYNRGQPKMSQDEDSRDPIPPPDRRAGELALPLAAALGLLLGIQLLRTFLPLATFYLHDSLGLSPLATGLVGLVVFAVGLRAPALARSSGWWGTTRWVAGLLAAIRIVEQLSTSPALDVRIALVGCALLALLLPLLLLAIGQSARLRSRLALFTVVALGLETALRTLGGTLDLSWRGFGWADPATLTVASACLVASILARRRATASAPPAAAAPWSWAALGAWLALYLLVYSNPAQLAARADMPLERASGFVLGGWLAGLAVLAAVPLHAASRWRAVEAAAMAVVGSWIAVFGGEDAWFGVLIGAPGMALLLFDLLAGRPSRPARGAGTGGAGIVTLGALYLAYGRFDQPLGPAEPVVYAAPLALLVASSLAIAWRARRESPAALWADRLAGLAIAAAVAAAATHLLAPPPVPSTVATDGPIRVMTYNVHQGFDVEGRLDPEALATTIELQRPDLLALQEVPRGWLVTGGLDLHPWLTRRLVMAGRFAGTADPQWGNAVLSRLPIADSVYHPLPPEELPLRRGVLDVTVRTRRGPLRVLCVHLHHTMADGHVRLLQAEALLEIWGGTPGTLVLGDFNALPDSPAIARLRAAGLHDASAMLAPDGRGTTTRLDGRQIDWIFATPDLAFENTGMRWSRASDHLALYTTVHLTTRFGRAAPRPSATAPRRAPPN